MWKRTRQKGQGLIEYALLLAIVVGIGSILTSGFGDSISAIFGNASNLLGTVASNTKDSSSTMSSNDRNMKWLKDTLMGYISEDWFQDQVNYAITKRDNLDFTEYRDNLFGGLSDSESNSNFMNQINDSDLGDCSWVMSEYMKDGKQYYGVSIYDPSKNGGQKLSALKPGTEGIITDIYQVDPNTGKVTQLESNVKQNVKQKTDKNGYTYNVIRGNPQK